jgi:DNA-binding PadR family transcriptional regulator
VATTETRLLLLGAVSIFEPVNGYQIRRELVSWGVEDWANIKPGSIYHGLSTLAQRGDLVRHDLRDGTREVAVYETSDQGRAEFDRLFAHAVTQVRPTAPLAFNTALALVGLVTRQRAIELLAQRLATLDRLVEEAAERETEPGTVPPHVLAMVDYWDGQLRTERDWLVRLVFSVRDGGLGFAGEPMRWTPPPEDPGHQMFADRERYLALLHR